MSTANFTEKLLFFTSQKSRLNNQLSNIQMQQLSATRSETTSQMAYNQQLQELYYDPVCGYGTEEYTEILVALQNDHEFKMASLTAWESQLEAQKESVETQINEVTNYESSWQKMLANNIKVEFSYGGVGGGK